MEDDDDDEPLAAPPTPRTLQAFRRRGSAWRGDEHLRSSQQLDDPVAEEDDDDELEVFVDQPPVGPGQLAAHLRRAVDILLKVRPLCSRVAHRHASVDDRSSLAHTEDVDAADFPDTDAAKDLCEDADRNGSTEFSGNIPTLVPRTLEKLHVVQRSLDEALQLVEAASEDALVEISLRQHDSALKARDQADARSMEQRQLVAGVRCDIGELERSMLRSARTHRRLAIDGSAQRLEEIERYQANVEGVHGYLTNDLQIITESLVAQLRKNGTINKQTRQIQQASEVAMEENARANQLLGSGETLEVYRKAKERERIAADAEFVHARTECEAEIARLGEGWAQTEARYTAEMLELRAEVRSVQERLNAQTQEVDRTLARQASQWGQAVEDTDMQSANVMKALDDLRTEKATTLHREALRSRQREREVAASTKQRLAAQLDDVKLQYKARLRLEEVKLGSLVRKERLSVEAAKRNANNWATRATRVREAYRGHAIKNGAYVKTMEPAFRKEFGQVT